MKMTITTVALLLLAASIFAQDTIRSQKEWEEVRDKYAVQAIIMLARIDTLNLEIDSLKKLNEYAEELDCDEQLYKIVGATREEVSDFRNKFLITEKKINEKIGTPDDARQMYFNEISLSKIRCLPEFSDRFASLKKKLEPWYSELTVSEKIYEGTYKVKVGDNLKKISYIHYGTSNLWKLIWEANRDGVVNSDQIYEPHRKKISNPNLIYPGQILKIPSQGS